MKRKDLISVFLVLSLCAALFTGCGETGVSAGSASIAEPSVQETAAPAVNDVQEPEASANENIGSAEETVENAAFEPVPVELPICEEPMTVTQWTGVHPLAVQYVSSSEDFLVYQEIGARTGINFELTLVGANAEEESFNLMVAGSDYPDIITGMNYYSSGVSGAIEDDVIIDLYDAVQEYAPNYFHVLSQDPAAYTAVVTSEGKMGTLATMYKEKGLEDNGLMIRGDWLEEFQLGPITTYDDLHEYVKQVFSEKGVYMVLPNDGQLTQLSQGFGAIAGTYSTYHDEVKSYIETDGYYDYLSCMHDWYAEGIIDPDFVSRAGLSDLSNMFMADEASIGTAFASAMVGLNGIATDPNALYVGIANPKVNADDEYTIAEPTQALKDDDTWAISTSCDPEKVPYLLKLVDWLISEDGQLLFNYGVENETFAYDKNGVPQFTEMLTANQEGYSFAVAEVLYATAYTPGIIDLRRDFYSMTDVGMEALDLFSSQNTGLNCIPSNISVYLTTEESAEYANVSSDVETYMDSTILSFITGGEPLTEESYQAFVDRCVSMGLDKMDKIYQSAYDRYLEAVSDIA